MMHLKVFISVVRSRRLVMVVSALISMTSLHLCNTAPRGNEGFDLNLATNRDDTCSERNLAFLVLRRGRRVNSRFYLHRQHKDPAKIPRNFLLNLRLPR